MMITNHKVLIIDKVPASRIAHCAVLSIGIVAANSSL